MAAIEAVIRQAKIQRGDSRGKVALKLMRATSEQDDGYCVITASVSGDNLDDIVFQVVVDGHPDIITMKLERVFEIASQRLM